MSLSKIAADKNQTRRRNKENNCRTGISKGIFTRFINHSVSRNIHAFGVGQPV
jgi:SET domain-containing protein